MQLSTSDSAFIASHTELALKSLVVMKAGNPIILVRAEESRGGFSFEYATLPTEGRSLVGREVSYIEQEDSDYKYGGFYCLPDGEWQEASGWDFDFYSKSYETRAWSMPVAVSLKQAAFLSGLGQNDLDDFLSLIESAQ